MSNLTCWLLNCHWFWIRETMFIVHFYFDQIWNELWNNLDIEAKTTEFDEQIEKTKLLIWRSVLLNFAWMMMNNWMKSAKLNSKVWYAESWVRIVMIEFYIFIVNTWIVTRWWMVWIILFMSLFMGSTCIVLKGAFGMRLRRTTKDWN